MITPMTVIEVLKVFLEDPQQQMPEEYQQDFPVNSTKHFWVNPISILGFHWTCKWISNRNNLENFRRFFGRYLWSHHSINFRKNLSCNPNVWRLILVPYSLSLSSEVNTRNKWMDEGPLSVSFISPFLVLSKRMNETKVKTAIRIHARNSSQKDSGITYRWVSLDHCLEFLRSIFVEIP